MESETPKAVLAHWERFAEAAHAPAWISVAPDGSVLASGGDLARYGMESLASGCCLEDHADWSIGIFPLDGGGLVIERLEVVADVWADLHLIRDDHAHDFVLLLDVTLQAREHALYKQAVNDLQLERQRRSR